MPILRSELAANAVRLPGLGVVVFAIEEGGAAGDGGQLAEFISRQPGSALQAAVQRAWPLPLLFVRYNAVRQYRVMIYVMLCK